MAAVTGPQKWPTVGAAMFLVAVMVAAVACFSTAGRPVAVTDPAVGPTSTGPSATTIVATGHLPTVPNCGGGAFEPETLLIVCGVSSAMATGVSWAYWSPTSATGTGKVHLSVGGRPVEAPARLSLAQVRTGSTGPQYSQLTVTWTGPSPDGHRQDVYRLAVG
jgi:hypothetical protein